VILARSRLVPMKTFEALTTKLLKEGKITNKTGGYHPLNHKLPRMVVRPSKNSSTMLNVIKIHQN
jgi:hypothetical protein